MRKDEIISIKDESGDEKMLWETIGKPAYEKGLLEGRQEIGMFAIIPVSILENKELSANAKLLYGEIMALSKKSGKCYATNEYISEMLGLKKNSIRGLLKELSGTGLIIIDIERSNKGTYRNITISYFYGGEHQSKRGGSIRHSGGGALDNAVKRDIDKVEIDNNTTLSPKGDKGVKEYNFQTKLTELLKDKRRDLRIIALYWQYKAFKFENEEQWQSALKRELRPAKALVGYSEERIKEVMEWLGKNADFAWKLETIHKLIDEDLSTLKSFRKSSDISIDDIEIPEYARNRKK